MKTGTSETVEKLKQENKKLKTTNVILTIYLIASLAIMAYNYFL